MVKNVNACQAAYETSNVALFYLNTLSTIFSIFSLWFLSHRVVSLFILIFFFFHFFPYPSRLQFWVAPFFFSCFFPYGGIQGPFELWTHPKFPQQIFSLFFLLFMFPPTHICHRGATMELNLRWSFGSRDLDEADLLAKSVVSA